MKLNLPLVVSLFALPMTAFSQEKCGSHELIEYRESKIPGYKARVEEQFNSAKNWSETHEPRRVTYTIPVVFHVVYKTAAENLHDSIILNQLAVLNADYGRQNADTVNLRSVFNPIAGKTNIRFELASVDPQGNPTTGITRTSTNLSTFFDGTMESIERVKSTANGGHDPWNQSRYLNIWVCNMTIFGMPILLGYATPPADLPNWPAGSVDGLGDGVVLLHQVVGSNNPIGVPGYDMLGRTATHEVGHYLGLRHIWGDEDDCSGSDGISDTPGAAGSSEQDCNPSKNSCTDNIGALGDLPDMIENFMDYSAETCQNSFTKGQKDLMHGVLEDQREDLWNNNPALSLHENFIAVSCYPNPSKDVVHISTTENITRLTVTDINGKIVRDLQTSGMQADIDAHDLQSGIYILRTESGNSRFGIQKFTVAQ